MATGNHRGYNESRGGGTADSVGIVLSDICFDPLPKTLFSDIAERAAKDVSNDAGREFNKPSQLRRFYEEFVNLQQKVGNSQEKYEEVAPFIQMLKAKVAYALGRKKVSGDFQALLKHTVDQAKDPITLRHAKLFLEAFMAFYKLHGPREG